MPSPKPRNPDWTRDELILALDLYFRVGRKQVDKTHPEVVTLSTKLRELPLHNSAQLDSSFRNANAVSMKLGNFVSVDPTYHGAGLSRRNRLDREVFDDFASDPELLRSLAELISKQAEELGDSKGTESALSDDPDFEFPEGGLLTRMHVARERNRTLIRKKKAQCLNLWGHLACELCGFDFEKVYGKAGHGFAECHHKKPIAELKPGEKTRLSDLMIICANCHRMLHCAKPLLSPEDLKLIIAQK